MRFFAHRPVDAVLRKPRQEVSYEFEARLTYRVSFTGQFGATVSQKGVSGGGTP